MISLHTKFHMASSLVIISYPHQTGRKYRFHAAGVLFSILKKNYLTKNAFFLRSITVHHFRILCQVTLMWPLRHKFVRPQCFYCWLYEIKKAVDWDGFSWHNVRTRFRENRL